MSSSNVPRRAGHARRGSDGTLRMDASEHTRGGNTMETRAAGLHTAPPRCGRELTLTRLVHAAVAASPFTRDEIADRLDRSVSWLNKACVGDGSAAVPGVVLFRLLTDADVLGREGMDHALSTIAAVAGGRYTAPAPSLFIDPPTTGTSPDVAMRELCAIVGQVGEAARRAEVGDFVGCARALGAVRDVLPGAMVAIESAGQGGAA